MEKKKSYIDIWQIKKVKKYKYRISKFVRIINLSIFVIIILMIIIFILSDPRILSLIDELWRVRAYPHLLLLLFICFLLPFIILSGSFIMNFLTSLPNKIYLKEDSLVEIIYWPFLKREISYKDIKTVRIGQFREALKEEFVMRREKFIPFLKGFYNTEVVIVEVFDPKKKYVRFLGIPFRSFDRPGILIIWAEDTKGLYSDLINRISQIGE